MVVLNSLYWLTLKFWYLLKVVYYGLEFLLVLMVTIIAYTVMLPFMLIIFTVRFFIKAFKKKGEKVNVQSIRKRN